MAATPPPVARYIYADWGRGPVIQALFFGLKAAVLAIVLEAVVRIGRRALKNQAMIALAGAAFIGIFFFSVPFPLIVFGAALIGFCGDEYVLFWHIRRGHYGDINLDSLRRRERRGDLVGVHRPPLAVF
jgi:chromate transport protein ChrA